MFKLLTFFLLLFSFVLPLQAEETALQNQLKKSDRQQVIRVIDGDTVILKDRSRVRLVGIQAPKLPLGRKRFRQWPQAGQSRQMLTDLILNKFVTLYYGGEKQDRYGRTLAHLFRDDGLWVQGEMLTQGLARVYSFPDNRAIVREMLDRETIARQQKRGIWALDFYRPRHADRAMQYRNSFQLVMGIVQKVAKVRGTYYLNFGADWREDFTIVIKAKAARRFIKANLDPTMYEGKKIEVRGWLKTYNGPMIEATHPEQIVTIE